ncbi:MAG: hypothetical protein J6B21_07705 [Oscillospiraceae bacterium]|nr:hypothetical protein [Oscillospiraceae bacterium]
MKQPSLKYSLLIIIVTFGIVTVPVIVLGISVQPLFLLSLAAAIPLCMRLGYSFTEIQSGMTEYSKKAFSPILFMLAVGAMTGVWNSCGTIAEITKLGINLVSPSVFLPACFLLCMIFALFTGTAFGTCGTVGLALIVMSASFSIPSLITASAVISGTYFGYVFSPLSDYNNLACGLVEKDIVSFIVCQLKITAPSAAICLVIYYFINKNYAITLGNPQDTQLFVSEIENIFNTGIINFVPLAIVLVIMFMRKPTLIAIISGIVSGGAVSVLYQGNSFADVIESMWTGAKFNGGNEIITAVFSRGGMQSMSGVCLLFILAFALMGALNTCGITEVIIKPVDNRIKGVFSASVYTLIITFAINAMSASGITSCVIVLDFMLPIYKSKNLDLSVLMTTSTIGGILCTLMIPWHSNCINSASFLGVMPTDIITVMFAPAVAVVVCLVYLALSNFVVKKQK